MQGVRRESVMRKSSTTRQQVEVIKREKIIEVIKEVPVPVEREVEVKYDVIVDVPIERTIEHEKIIEVHIEKPIEKVLEVIVE